MTKTTSFEGLQSLIEELSKSKPNQTRVKKLMLAQGLLYSPDCIQQMSTVLSLMSQISPGMERSKLKEKVSEA